MRLYQELHPAQEDTAVALGVFDGLHMGHRRVIAEALGGPQTPAVFTFQTDILGERGKGAPWAAGPARPCPARRDCPSGR